MTSVSNTYQAREKKVLTKDVACIKYPAEIFEGQCLDGFVFHMTAQRHPQGSSQKMEGGRTSGVPYTSTVITGIFMVTSYNGSRWEPTFAFTIPSLAWASELSLLI